MCGISGFVGGGNREVLKLMNDVITHRGPDDEGFFSDEDKRVYLAHRRLSIVDISGGHQPMFSSDGNIGIIFNGEIYNHQDIRKELQADGYTFKTDHSDTETLIYAYRKWGPKMFEKLNGMWAFAIYDRIKNKLLLSRDRFGKKPLFYSIQKGTFAFGSELSSLKLHPNIESTISVKSLQKYFAYGYIPAPNSIYEKCYKLPAGNYLELDITDLTYSISQYWEYNIEPFETIPDNPISVWGEELVDLLDKAVQRRLMSDVPLGFFLSGGIDSSSIVAMASRHLSKENLKTFSIGFSEASFDESEYSKLIAKQFDTDHYTRTLSIDECLNILPDIVTKLDEPMGDSSLVPSYLLCRETRKHVTVALGGDGADELFCGYDPFLAIKKAGMYSKIIPKPVHKGILALISLMPVSHKNMSLDFKLKRTLNGLSFPAKLWNPVWMGALLPKEIKELFHDNISTEDLFSEAITAWESSKSVDIIDKISEFYVKLYLQDDILVKVDRASMMNSLEVRAPYLDIDFVNFARKIPNSYKLKGSETKYILKKSLESVLPNDILYRKKKGFGMPVGMWLKEEKLKTNNFSDNKITNQAIVKKYWEEHISGKKDNRFFLWNLWLLENWKNK